MTINTTICSPNVTFNTNSSSGTYSVLPFNCYFVNSSSQIYNLPVSPQIGDTYEFVGVNSGPFIIKASGVGANTQLILWQDTGGQTLTSPGLGYSSSITIIYAGVLFGTGPYPTFCAKSTNGAAFVITA